MSENKYDLKVWVIFSIFFKISEWNSLFPNIYVNMANLVT